MICDNVTHECHDLTLRRISHGSDEITVKSFFLKPTFGSQVHAVGKPSPQRSPNGYILSNVDRDTEGDLLIAKEYGQEIDFNVRPKGSHECCRFKGVIDTANDTIFKIHKVRAC